MQTQKMRILLGILGTSTQTLREQGFAGLKPNNHEYNIDGKVVENHE